MTRRERSDDPGRGSRVTPQIFPPSRLPVPLSFRGAKMREIWKAHVPRPGSRNGTASMTRSLRLPTASTSRDPRPCSRSMPGWNARQSGLDRLPSRIPSRAFPRMIACHAGSHRVPSRG
jgi:hypothetical protein